MNVARIAVGRGNDTFALVDAEDAERLNLSGYRWYKVSGYAVNPKLGYMHRAILGLVKGEQRFVHHVNENPLDNRKANLQVFESMSECNRAPHPIRDRVCGMTADEREAAA